MPTSFLDVYRWFFKCVFPSYYDMLQIVDFEEFKFNGD